MKRVAGFNSPSSSQFKNWQPDAPSGTLFRGASWCGARSKYLNPTAVERVQNPEVDQLGRLPVVRFQVAAGNNGSLSTSSSSGGIGGTGGSDGGGGNGKIGGKHMGIFERIISMDLKEMMAAHLTLQVDVAFDKHYDFMVRHGLGECVEVLDAGVGTGYFCCRVAELNPQIAFTGIDNNDDMVERATKTAQEMETTNTRWLNENALEPTELASRQFDGIMLRFAAGHMMPVEQLLTTAFRLLKPGGRIWIIDVDLKYMGCTPPHEAFDLYKVGTKKLYEAHGIDSHLGGRLPSLLEAAGFQSPISEVDYMSNREIGVRNYQRYLLHEARLFNAYQPDAISDDALQQIGAFVENVVPSDEFYGRYGVVMIAAQKPRE